jgi:hypothetical protein
VGLIASICTWQPSLSARFSASEKEAPSRHCSMPRGSNFQFFFLKKNEMLHVHE